MPEEKPGCTNHEDVMVKITDDRCDDGQRLNTNAAVSKHCISILCIALDVCSEGSSIRSILADNL